MSGDNKDAGKSKPLVYRNRIKVNLNNNDVEVESYDASLSEVRKHFEEIMMKMSPWGQTQEDAKRRINSVGIR